MGKKKKVNIVKYLTYNLPEKYEVNGTNGVS
jgi:hypothetical protein